MNHPKIFEGVHLPEQGTVAEVEAVKLSFSPININAMFIDNGTAARPTVITIKVNERRREGEFPKFLAGFSIEAVDHRLVRSTIELEVPPKRGRPDSIRGPKRPLPEDLRWISFPIGPNPLLTRNTIAIWT